MLMFAICTLDKNSLKHFNPNLFHSPAGTSPAWSDSDAAHTGRKQMSLFSLLSQAKWPGHVRYHPD